MPPDVDELLVPRVRGRVELRVERIDLTVRAPSRDVVVRLPVADVWGGRPVVSLGDSNVEREEEATDPFRSG